MSSVNSPFTVHPFSREQLFTAISNKRFSVLDMDSHPRVSYLYDYLCHLNTRRIVVEFPYVDGDYLDDFIASYANCFSPYRRFCKRIHFFDVALTKKELTNLIQGIITLEGEEKVLKSYLGFIVARPLPQAVIGRTVLKTYESDKAERGRRHYTVTREYTPNFFGVEFSVVKSLAFQEQDKAVAACATVALWCCFHKTAKLFGTPSPSPAAITRAANQIARDSRMIPSQGLSIEQICNAIHHVGLEPEVIILEEELIIATAYSYLHMGLPVIVIAEAVDEKSQSPKLHAITLTGYSVANHKFAFEEIPTKGQYIDELYGHDDQVGPFSRMYVKHLCFLNHKDKNSHNGHVGVLLETPVGKSYKITHFIIPVYKKIRLSFSDNLDWVNRLDKFIRYMCKTIFKVSDNLEWDIHLIQVNEYKKYLRESFCHEYNSLILDLLPRFIWRSILEDNGNKIIELISDATEMPGSFPIYRVVWHNPEFKSLMLLFIDWSYNQSESLSQEAAKLLTKRFIDLLKE